MQLLQGVSNKTRPLNINVLLKFEYRKHATWNYECVKQNTLEVEMNCIHGELLFT
jgi:hypothetical protein